MNHTLGEALRRHRQGHGVSQKLAARLQVDPSTLVKWERDERVPVGDYRQQIDSVLVK